METWRSKAVVFSAETRVSVVTTTHHHHHHHRSHYDHHYYHHLADHLLAAIPFGIQFQLHSLYIEAQE